MRQSQPFQNSRIAHRLLNSPVNHWIEALSHLLHYAIDFAWLSHDQNEQNSERLSFPPRPFLARHVCHVIELGRYFCIPLFKQCSCLLKFTWHFLLAENVFTLKRNYYSFKIFPQFWSAKSTHIIHHNQLLMTKFGRTLCLTRKWSQKCSQLQVNAPLTEKTWGLRPRRITPYSISIILHTILSLIH